MEQQLFPFLKKTAHAVLSEDRVYRYALWRSLDNEAWDAGYEPDAYTSPERFTLCFVLLNPSTADENTNDPTIDKLIKYGKAWNYQRLVVVNLFAYRETYSEKLPSLASGRDIIGPDNDLEILKVVQGAHKVVCGWGKHGAILDRGPALARKLAIWLAPRTLWCFKKNLDGSPVHPLYQPGAASLVEYR